MTRRASPKRERTYAELERLGVKVIRAENCKGPYGGAEMTAVVIDECPQVLDATLDGKVTLSAPITHVQWAPKKPRRRKP